MRKLTPCIIALLLTISPAFAQMGGGMGGMGGMGGGRGRGAMDTVSDDQPSAPRRPQGLKPISQEQFDKAVSAMFAAADLNHDGMVTLTEIQSVIDTRREAIIRAHFKDIDTNHDGRIDLNEFIAWQHDMGSAAASECAAYVDPTQIVPETLGPDLGTGEKDEALRAAIEPLSATMLTRANIHYRPGATLEDVLAYENKRFDTADTNRDGFLEEGEIDAMHEGHRGRPSAPGRD